MSAITRKNLLNNLTELKNKRDELKNKKYDYKVNRQWPGLPKISDITEVTILVKLFTSVNNAIKSYREAGKVLNLEALGLYEGDETYYGYTYDEWIADMQLRAQHMADEETIIKLNKAINILTKNMSDDDKFMADMEAVTDLIK